MDFQASTISTVLEQARVSLQESMPYTPRTYLDDRSLAGQPRPMSGRLCKVDTPPRSHARTSTEEWQSSYHDKELKTSSRSRPSSASSSSFQGASRTPLRPPPRQQHHHRHRGKDEEQAGERKPVPIEEKKEQKDQQQKDRDHDLIEQWEDWRAHLTCIMSRMEEDIKAERWARIGATIATLDPMLDPLLSSVSLHDEDQEAEENVLRKLRDKTKAILLCILRKGVDPTIRLQAFRLCLKMLRIELSTFCHQQQGASSSSSSDVGRRPTKQQQQQPQEKSVMIYLGQACAIAFALSTDNNYDKAFLTTEALDALLSLLGADTELLLNVVHGYLKEEEEELDVDGKIVGRRGRRKERALRVVSTLQPLVHAAGVIKNLSSVNTSQGHQERMGRLGAIHVCAGVLAKARKLVESFDGKLGISGSKHTMPRSGLGRRAMGGNNDDEDAEEKDREAEEEEEEEENEVLTAMKSKVVALLQQITVALRNLCIDKAYHRQMAAVKLPQVLCSLIRPFALESRELMLHVTRVLSKLSLQEALRANINNDPATIRDLMYLLEVNSVGGGGSHVYGELLRPHTMALVVRIAFILGNLTATNNGNRRLLGLRFKGVDVVVELLELVGSMYLAIREGDNDDDEEEDEEDSGSDSDDDGKKEEEEEEEPRGRQHQQRREDRKAADKEKDQEMCLQMQDVLIKLLRLLGNMSIDKDVGRLIARSDGIETVVNLLRFSVESPSPGPAESNEKQKQQQILADEELLLNTVGALSNLTYYMTGEDALHPLRTELALHLYDVLLHHHHLDEALTEAARALGNLSRDTEVRQVLAAIKADYALVYLLDHPSRHVTIVVVGALVNLNADSTFQPELMKSELELGTKLVRILRQAGLRDLELSLVTCKALFNVMLLSEEEELGNAFGEEVSTLLEDTLHELIDTVKDVVASEGENGEEKKGGIGREDRACSSLYEPFLEVTRALQKHLRAMKRPLSRGIDTIGKSERPMTVDMKFGRSRQSEEEEEEKGNEGKMD